MVKNDFIYVIISVLLLIYIAAYIIILLLVWGFYAVARMHTMKFKNFSTHIVPITNFLMFFLILLSILGFVFLFFLVPDNSHYEISTGSDNSVIENTDEESEKNYKEDIIGEEYY